MNNALDKLERLAAAARHEDPPAVDVVSDVARQLRLLRAERRVWFSALSAAAATAALVAITCFPLWNALTDPLGWLYRWDYLAYL